MLSRPKPEMIPRTAPCVAIPELRQEMKQGIVVPEARPPGEDEHENSKIEADGDAKKEFEALQPQRGGLLEFWQRFGLRLGRAGGEFR